MTLYRHYVVTCLGRPDGDMTFFPSLNISVSFLSGKHTVHPHSTILLIKPLMYIMTLDLFNNKK